MASCGGMWKTKTWEAPGKWSTIPSRRKTCRVITSKVTQPVQGQPSKPIQCLLTCSWLPCKSGKHRRLQASTGATQARWNPRITRRRRKQMQCEPCEPKGARKPMGLSFTQLPLPPWDDLNARHQANVTLCALHLATGQEEIETDHLPET